MIKFVNNAKLNIHIIIFAIPSLVVGYLGLNRPYYFTPDQDLLWVSQSVRLFKGLAPSYADHPGSYWPLSFLIKIFIFSETGISNFLDQKGSGALEVIEKLIYFSRIENAIISALIPILFYFLLREFKIGNKVAFVSSYSLAFSSAILNTVSDIRHENIGMFFLMLYLILTCKQISSKRSSTQRKISLFINPLLFYASIFCKQQILILSPFLLLIFLYALKLKNFAYYQYLINELTKKNISKVFIFFMISGIPWIFISLEEITKFGFFYLINLPFWCFINSILVLVMFGNILEKVKFQNFLKNLFALSLLQIIIFEILSPNIWRRAVTAFPAYLFPFSSLNDKKLQIIEKFNDFFYLLDQASRNLSWPENLGFLFFMIFLIFTIYKIYLSFKNKIYPNLKDYSISLIFLLFGILSLRYQDFYQIYFFIPILFLISISLSKGINSGTKKKEKLIRTNFLFFASLILLISFSIKSTINIFKLNEFVSTIQSEKSFCNTQALDFSMGNTIVAECKNFEEESAKKIRFDNWY